MHIFLDTANIDEIREAVALGVISGVTTNPSLVSKEATSDYESVVKAICELVDGSVSAEVIAEDTDGMVAEGRIKSSWAENVTVKVPITAAGLRATSILAAEDIETNLTLCFSVNQALLAARAGASYVSPFVGRLDDIGEDGMALVADIIEVFAEYDIDTEVIAASIRGPLHVVAAAKAGADIVTVPYKVLMQMIQHPLTDIGIERFLADWRQVSGK
jgi:transaldolase